MTSRNDRSSKVGLRGAQPKLRGLNWHNVLEVERLAEGKGRVVSPKHIAGMSNVCWVVLLALLLGTPVTAGGLYKWVDDQGGVHYSDKPPEKGKARELEVPPSPSQGEIDSARQRGEQMKKDAAGTEQRRQSSAVPGAPLGPLPQNATSEYLTTTGSGVAIDFNGRRPRFTFRLFLRARDDIPAGTYLIAHFENPANPSAPMLVTKQIEVAGRAQVKEVSIGFISPDFEMIHCKDYEVLVYVYRSESHRELLGTHRQLIQSRMDSDLLTSRDAVFKTSRAGGLCP
jgi:uncharacterized protein DUF4124